MALSLLSASESEPPAAVGGVTALFGPLSDHHILRVSSGGGSSGDVGTTQERILDYVTQHPGTHLRLMCRELGLAMGDVQYHVQRLEREGRINSVRRGLYRFFYSSTLLGDRQRDLLSVLALETPRELLLSLVEKPNSSQDELARATRVSQPTVSWHLKRMIDMGILQKQQSGRGAAYVVAGGGAEVAALIRSYHPNIWEKWSSRLADIFISYSREENGERA